jgi:hypothetical protein
MTRGKKTDIETKAKIAEMRITKWMLWTDIADELGINERTVQRVIENEVSEVVAESDLIQWIIKDAVEASKVMWEITLTMAKDIKNRQLWEANPTTDEIRTLNATVAEWFKRSQLLQGKATENINFVWDVLQEIQWLK